MDISDDPPPPVSLQFSGIQQLSNSRWFHDLTPLRSSDNNISKQHESLLTLAHYLDCAQMMQQCEAAMMTAAHVDDENYSWLVPHCWSSLQYSSRYKLEKAKAFHIATIPADDDLLETEEYKDGKLWMDNALVVELMDAVLK